MGSPKTLLYRHFLTVMKTVGPARRKSVVR
jgi:hypothetical protein